MRTLLSNSLLCLTNSKVSLVLLLMMFWFSHPSPARPTQAVTPQQSTSPELIYSTNFSVNSKVFFLFVERKPSTANTANTPNYQVRVSYPRIATVLAPAAGAPAAGAPAAGAPAAGAPAAGAPAAGAPTTPVIIERTVDLVDLNDIDSFVNGTMAALQHVQNQAAATTPTGGYVADDAPFGSISTNVDNIKEQFRKELRRIYQIILVQKLTLVNAPVAGIVRLEKKVGVYKELSRKAKRALIAAEADSAGEDVVDNYFRGITLRGQLSKKLKSIIDRQKIRKTVGGFVSEAGTFTMDSLQIEVEDGNVVNVKAHGYFRSDGSEVEKFALFESFAPIGISTNQDLNLWYLQKLYIQNRLDGDEHEEFILLGQLAQYIPSLSAKSSDFSPADGVYTFHSNDTRPKRILYKVATSRILQARIFTDIVGVDQDRPNGLLQLEANRKFILTNRPLIRGRALHLFLLKYIDPTIAITKIEEQNKYLYLPTRRVDSLIAQVSTIDLVKFTNFSTGFNLNVASAYFPQVKLVFDLDMTLRLNRVAIRDSVFNKGAFSTVTEKSYSVGVYGLTFRATVRPDSRYGGSFGIGWMRYSLIDDAIEQFPVVRGTGRSFTQKFTYQDVLRYDMTLWARIAEHGELFFRPQFTYLRRQSSQNFFQAQLGYQFDVFSNRRAATPVVPLF
jgi:hypothetical protein